jgi:uncharacterized membrane protein
VSTIDSFLTASQEKNVVHAIQNAEKGTSGEIRVHIENHTKEPTLVRAKEVFLLLEMEQTKQRNGVLLYIAVDSKQFAIIGDKGIDQLVSETFWNEEKEFITNLFTQNKNEEALIKGIAKVGEKLKRFFPYHSDDINELPDSISKG